MSSKRVFSHYKLILGTIFFWLLVLIIANYGNIKAFLQKNKEAQKIREQYENLLELANSKQYETIYYAFYPKDYILTQNKFIATLNEQKNLREDYYKKYYDETFNFYKTSDKYGKITAKVWSIEIAGDTAWVKREIQQCGDGQCTNPTKSFATIKWTKEHNTWKTSEEFPLCRKNRSSLSNSSSRLGENMEQDSYSGTLITWNAECSMFPVYWYSSPISASATSLNKKLKEEGRSTGIIKKALRKYPKALLNTYLQKVYILDSIYSFGIGYGGTYTNTAIMITNRGKNQGYSDTYIEQMFHREFVNLLLLNTDKRYVKGQQILDIPEWSKFNPPKFEYGNSQGYDEIREGKGARDFNFALANVGFINQYALSSLLNDFSEIAQNLFKAEKDFWKIHDANEKIKKKTKIVIDFYNKLDPQFTETYFRKISK